MAYLLYRCAPEEALGGGGGAGFSLEVLRSGMNPELPLESCDKWFGRSSVCCVFSSSSLVSLVYTHAHAHAHSVVLQGRRAAPTLCEPCTKADAATRDVSMTAYRVTHVRVYTIRRRILICFILPQLSMIHLIVVKSVVKYRQITSYDESISIFGLAFVLVKLKPRYLDSCFEVCV